MHIKERKVAFELRKRSKSLITVKLRQPQQFLHSAGVGQPGALERDLLATTLEEYMARQASL